MADRASIFRDKSILLCAVVCALGLGGFLLWAGTAPLEEGVTASGQLVVRGDRKEIAHFEGGIVREIHVAEGQQVDEGELLITLEPVQSEAQRDDLAQQLFAAEAGRTRLEALRDDLGAPQFPDDGLALSDDVRQGIIDQEARVFAEEREAFTAERRVLATRRDAATGRARDLAAQITATRANLDVARDELSRRQEALAEQLDTVANVQRAERDVLALEAELAGLVSRRNDAISAAEEAGTQEAELVSRFRRDIETGISEASRNVLSLTQQLEASDDRLSRTLLRAPLDGIVLGLEANTVGGIVRPGEPVMEIVPEESRLIALIRIPPTDREAVQPGQAVVAQLSAYKQYSVPRISGEVLSVSADLREEPSTGAQFYEARVLLDPETLTGLTSVELVPGLPVEAFIASGRARTFLDYMLEPIASTVRRGLSLQ
ncbi:HlyD family type I secretion periplasmic adaptor subunit [Parvularcula sp. ZS-1/3]|uniref:Membrane fusion protein (MFP) family protein n=1 Tax=Parvularcula mediterranea TaxID=2732508 RepID=A0A7Y3W6V3_9PROT|nr:HlyD family type I secretion periplasmic adaptor subunit [Parvularcula mediterranea]NNU17661.1 HlyD family type I secretion periplasmic adaptor subunit [Parvularcula mediterranea]